MNSLLLGLLTGTVFGFLLQKGRVLRFEKQVGAMLLRDMTILKFMLSAIIVGMIGFHVLKDFGVIELKHKPMNVGAVVVGGLLFGAGWAVMGYCPGTAVGALGEGRWHASFAVLGMFAGAAIYAESYPFMLHTLLSWKDFGRISLPEAIGVSHWIIIPVFSLGMIALFAWFEKRKL
jgi:uncharacterized membrane protein YedE/YeeE